MEKNLSTLNEIMDRKTNSTSSFIESDGLFIIKPFDVGNYFNDDFIGKVGRLRQEIPTKNSEPSYSCIKTNNERKALRVKML